MDQKNGDYLKSVGKIMGLSALGAAGAYLFGRQAFKYSVAQSGSRRSRSLTMKMSLKHMKAGAALMLLS